MVYLIFRNVNRTYSQGGDVIPQWVTACVIHAKFNVREQAKVAFFLAPWVPSDPTVPSTTPRPHDQNHVRSGVPGTGKGEGSGRSASTGQHLKPERFTAPAQMPISKVCWVCTVLHSKCCTCHHRASLLLITAVVLFQNIVGAFPPIPKRLLTPIMSFVYLQVISYVLSNKPFSKHLQRPDEADSQEGHLSKEGQERFTAASGESVDLVEVLCGDRVLEPHLYIGET